MEIEAPLTLLTDKVTGWAEALITMLPNFVVAVVVVLVAWGIGRALRSVVRKAVARSTHNRDLARLAAGIAGMAVLIGGVFVALGLLGLEKTVTTLLAGAGVVGLALGFAFQDTAANLISGIALTLRQPFAHGDLVQLGDDLAKVEKINLRSTELRRLDGPIVYLPNRTVFQNRIVNYTQGRSRRVELAVGVSYSEGLRETRNVALASVDDLEGRATDRKPEFFWTGFGGSSIDGVLRFWIEDTGQPAFLKARNEAVMRLKRAFDENGITIPFPIRTLDFGIEGGVALGEALPRHLNLPASESSTNEPSDLRH